MKQTTITILSALFALLGAMPSWAQATELAGKTLSVGENVTTLETGKWYFLYNVGTQAYTKELTGNQLSVTTTSPHGLDAVENAGYLVQLEQAGGEGKYYLKSGLGNYYRNVTSSKCNGTEATTRSTSVYTIERFGSDGHWSLKSNGLYYLQSNGSSLIGGNSLGSAGGDRDWMFREVTLNSIDDMTGAAYVRYILSKGGLVRLTNRRATSASLTDDGTGTKGARSSATDFSQIWILSANGDGYSLRNGQTARYLSDSNNFRSPSTTPARMYVQLSPNCQEGESYINICGDNSFSGNTCLNLNNDGTTLYKWACKGDYGSDWTISPVTEYTLQDVEDNLLSQSSFCTPVPGKYYRIKNVGYKTYMNEDYSSHALNVENGDKDKLSQYWTVEAAAGNRYFLRNVCTQYYIARQGGALSSRYTTQPTKPSLGFSFSRTDDDLDRKYYILDNGNVGLHADAARNVVGWSCQGIINSTWGFEEADIDEEFIQKGRDELAGFQNLINNMAAYNAALRNLFVDEACTTLQDDVQALTSEQLEDNPDYALLNDDLKAIVRKVKDGDWESVTSSDGYTRQEFEKFFRIRDDYHVYSNFNLMAGDQYTGTGNSFGKLSNPTGIVGGTGDIVYIFVDEEPSSDCTLQVEVVKDSQSPGDQQTGATTTLHKGLNAIALSTASTIYIFYQLDDPEKFLADYPDMKIHIEGGKVQGYFDMTRGMTNKDWKLMHEKMFAHCNVLNMKTDRIVFAMRADLLKNAIGASGEAEGTCRIWNNIIEVEEDLMGFKDDLQGRFNNVWNVFSVDHGYMYATTFGTYYSDGTIGEVFNYHNLTHNSGALWGPAHEMGHNHQASINCVGGTEVSNNLFSNVVVFLHGTSTTRGASIGSHFDSFAKGVPFVWRDIWQQTRLYYQLYLYYHAQGHKPDFYPTLFKMLRRNPMRKRTGPYDETLTNGDGEVVGGTITYGLNDYLHMAKLMCDAAEADLSEFFEAYGMFIPLDKVFVGDYSNSWVVTTEADIAAAKAYMGRYPKGPNLMFIDDRIKPSPVIRDGVFEGVPSGDYRADYDDNRIGSVGDVGQWNDYVTDYQTTGYFYTTTRTGGVTYYQISGTGAMGYKVYDLKGNLVYLSNVNRFALPEAVQAKVADGFRIMASEANGYDVLVPYGPATFRGEMTAYYEGSETPHTLYYYGTGTAAQSEISPLPVNSIAYVKPGQSTKKQPTESLLKTAGVVSGDGVAETIAIDGDKDFYIPTAFTAADLTFTKAGQGYQALCLPFAVSEGFYGTITDGELDKEVAAIASGDPVVVLGDATLHVAQAEVAAGLFQRRATGFALNAEGTSVEAQEELTPFTYDFGSAFDLGTGIATTLAVPNADAQQTYDLSGRRVTRISRPGLYIVNGRKVVVKD